MIQLLHSNYAMIDHKYKKINGLFIKKFFGETYIKMKKLLTLWLIAFFFFSSFLRNPLQISAQTFDPDNIITDNDLFNKNSMSKTAIQRFLEKKNSVLARYGQVVNGQDKKASEMIWEASQKYG